MTTRRDAIAALGAGALLLAAGVHSQPRPTGRMPRVVFVSYGTLGQSAGAFVAAMRTLGWRDGETARVEVRTAPMDDAAYPALVDELVRGRVDVVIGSGPSTRRLYPLLKGRLPMAYGFSGDPVEAGLAQSLAHPGGHASGVTMLALELVGKRVELLREVLPGLKRIGVLANPSHPGERAEFRESSRAAERLGIAIRYFTVRGPADFDAAFAAARAERLEALDLYPDGVVMDQAARVAAFAADAKMPAISGWNVFARAGNVFSYGPNLERAFAQVASFADRILRGANPGTLPVEYPTAVELVVNLKAARAIGLKVPPAVLVRADEVIE